MKWHHHEVFNLPVVVMEDFYLPKECHLIWKELEFLDVKNFNDPENTGGAWKEIDKQRVFLKKNKGIFLDTIFFEKKFSNILTCNRKIFSDEIISHLITQVHFFFRYLQISNQDSTIVQYYEDCDFYDFHNDSSILSFVTTFYKDEKYFTGGEFEFENGLIIECKNNQAILFPSILRHSVKKITMKNEFKNKNLGRYSITQLISTNIHQPSEPVRD